MNSIIQMYGSLFDVRCTKCGYTAGDLSNPLCPALGAAELQLEDYVDAGSKELNIPEADLPRCSLCGALARPGVVWFDKKPFKLDEINNLVYRADLCLVIGTSGTVRPTFLSIVFFFVGSDVFSRKKRCARHPHMHIVLNVVGGKLPSLTLTLLRGQRKLTLCFADLVKLNSPVCFRN
jgi:NAD-dependent SIR2 family protein deacetylase